MINHVRNARRFGAHDKPLCANCGNRTFLTRRSPAASYALELERQTFTCLECGQDFERVVDANGNTVRSTAIEARARNRDATLSSKADGGDDAQAFERIVIALHTAAADSADRIRQCQGPASQVPPSRVQGTCVLDWSLAPNALDTGA